MIFNIFKTLLCAFLIFLSCFIADVRGKSINELDEINTTEFDSAELNTKVIQETTSELDEINTTEFDSAELNTKVVQETTSELDEINTTEFDSAELNTKVIQETTSEESVAVSSAGPCDPNPCENGGSCITRIDYVEGFVCYCPVGFAGIKCEIDECDGINCQNNGTCYVLDGKAACKCPDGYTGDTCEKVNLCSEVCGENPGVVCDGDKTNRDAIMCFCKDEEKIFDQDEKDCKVKEDMNTCVFRNWYVSWETAAKLCADENSTLLCYKTRKEMKNILESFKLTTIDNAKFAIWLGNRNCTREKKEMEKCLSLHIEKSDKTEWHYFQTDCDEVNPFVCCVDGTSECDRVKCQNGGICNIIDGKAVCDCPIGYTGDVCEKHPCTNDPCLNGGQCIVIGTAFNCICEEPYFGKFCETNLCDQYICKNGGTCKVIREQPKCFCKEPYSGKFCDIRMDDCVTNFCENGGICRTMNGEPMCFCTEPYGGKFCNTRTDLRYNSTVFAVVYMLLGLVLICIGVLISCLLCRRICFGRK